MKPCDNGRFPKESTETAKEGHLYLMTYRKQEKKIVPETFSHFLTFLYNFPVLKIGAYICVCLIIKITLKDS